MNTVLGTTSEYHEAVANKAATLYHAGRVIPCRVLDTAVDSRGVDYALVEMNYLDDSALDGRWFPMSQLGPPLDPPQRPVYFG